MARKICKEPGCVKPVKARGWCSTHHRRWLRHGHTRCTRVTIRSVNDFIQHIDLVMVDPKLGHCHEFLGNSQQGYGRVWMGRRWQAHRLAWTMAVGPIPDGMQVNHLCHNRACIRIDHLRLGTHQDNADDMVRAGRQARGEGNGSAKLTEVDIREIRLMRQGGASFNHIARAYGVHPGTIRDIHVRRTWGHIV